MQVDKGTPMSHSSSETINKRIEYEIASKRLYPSERFVSFFNSLNISEARIGHQKIGEFALLLNQLYEAETKNITLADGQKDSQSTLDQFQAVQEIQPEVSEGVKSYRQALIEHLEEGKKISNTQSKLLADIDLLKKIITKLQKLDGFYLTKDQTDSLKQTFGSYIDQVGAVDQNTKVDNEFTDMPSILGGTQAKSSQDTPSGRVVPSIANELGSIPVEPTDISRTGRTGRTYMADPAEHSTKAEEARDILTKGA